MKRLAYALVIFCTTTLHASDGSTGAEFLKLPAGARAAALGNTQAAIAEGAFSVFTNPAALGAMRAGEVAFSHHELFEDAQEQRVGLAWPTRGGTFAFGYQRLAVEEFLGYDAQGTPTGGLDSAASAISLGWGRNLVQDADLDSGLLLGITAKSVQEEFAGVGASAFAADFGLIARPWGALAARHNILRRFSAGMYIRHLGQGLSYDNETVSLPTEYALGLGFTNPVGGDILTLGLDLYQNSADGSNFRAGVEYWLRHVFALRLGYEGSQVEGASLRAGAGFRLASVQVDYGWSAQGDDLDAVHRITVGYRFGPTPIGPGITTDLYKEHIARGKRNMEEGLLDRAILDFNEALKIDPKSEEARSLLLECGRRLEGPGK